MTTDGRHIPAGALVPVIEPDQLAAIIASASDISLLVRGDGVISRVLRNPHHRAFAQGSAWEGLSVASVMAEDSAHKLVARLADIARAPHTPVIVELNHADHADWKFPVRYVLHRVAADGAVLMLGRDLRQIAEVQQQLVSAQLSLERDYETQREMDTRYRVLMEVTRDPIVLISMSSGRIADLNPAAATMLGGGRADLVGAAIAQEFEGRRRGEFLDSLANLAVADSSAPLELTARRSQKRLLVTPTVFRAAGERILLCQLDSAEVQAAASTDVMAANLARLYHEGVDGIVFTDAEGVIEAANDAFLNLTDASNIAAVRGRSMADFLVRGAVDLRVMLDNVKRTGRLRLYATRLTTDFSGEMAVEVSATLLNDRPQPVLAMVVRDASRIESLRRPAVGTPDDGVRNVMELVGSSTLKDIVAETTDVIEKMCIETALELTRNNRVAAADMLSLSRQSLYVKLRKYGLLNKDGE